MATFILIGGFLFLVIIGVPISFALGISSLITTLYLNLDPQIVFQKMVDGIDSFSLLAIPFFILAGQIMSEGGIAIRLINLGNLIVGRIRGGLAFANILASMFFGGISGSSVADTSSIGSILIPSMIKKGYDKDFAVGVTITGSTQGIIIPPSHNAIIYSLAAGGAVSIGRLFLGGIIPGILIGINLMIASFIIATKRNYPKEEKMSLKQALISLKDSLFALGCALIIVGGVISGVFTATESAAIAVIYAFVVTFFVYREIKIKEMPKILFQSISTISMVVLLIATASSFGWLLAYLQVPKMTTDFFLNVSQNPVVILLLINVLLLFLGCIMDMAPLILITTPILLPVVQKIGMDPVHFGIMLMLNLGIGLCTPPVGSTLFVGCAIGKIKIEEAIKGLLPFYIAMIVTLLLVTYIPSLSLFIPNMVMK
jgi:tripartite ATP-independent transporter DctM subunit